MKGKIIMFFLLTLLFSNINTFISKKEATVNSAKNIIDEKTVFSSDIRIKYSDIKNRDTEYAASKLAENGIIKGENIGGSYYFHPDSTITRGEFIIYIISALNINSDIYSNSVTPFADSNEIPSWLLPYAKAAYYSGIISGNNEYGKTYLRPLDILTRIEAITMLNNAINPNGQADKEADFDDMYLVPSWGYDAVKNITTSGIISGFSDNTVRPFIKITKGDAAEMIWKLVCYRKDILN